MAESPIDPEPNQEIAPKPFKTNTWLARTSFILALASLAAIPLLCGATFSAGFVNVPLLVLVWILVGATVASIIAIATGIWALVLSNKSPLGNLSKGLAIEGIVLGALAIVPSMTILILFFVLIIHRTCTPNGC